MENKFLLLDCTIRDGGYINNWNFELEMVSEMYKSSSSAGTDIFEMGFLSDNLDLPIWRRCTGDLINSIKHPDGARISVMLESDTIGISLPLPEETGIDIIRIALNKDKIKSNLASIEKYYFQGYQIFIQLMGITSYTDIEILTTLEMIEKSGVVDYVNIGDSYGSLVPEKTAHIISLMKSNTKLKVGLHPHNNMQLGMANILAAINSGADVIDGSMYGMGRGGGNVPLELILSYYGKIYPERFTVLPVLKFIDQYMVRLYSKYSWGYSLPALLSGVYECHPYYTSKLVDKREYTIEQILKTVQIVNSSDVIGFSDDLLTSIIENGFARNADELQQDLNKFIFNNKESVSYYNRHKGKDFLILGNGSSLLTYKKNIDKFIANNDIIIMGANNLNGMFVPNYHAFNNQRRFEQFLKTVSPTSTLLIGPGINDLLLQELVFEKIICYNSSITKFDIVDHIITSNCYSISILMAAVAIVMGAKSINFAGLDGYSNGSDLFYDEDQSSHIQDIESKHSRNQAYLKQLADFAKEQSETEINFLTPTLYKI